MKVSIIGAAGTVGSATAFAIALQGLADELVLTDQNQGALGNHAMDINTAVGTTQKITVRAGRYEDLGGTDITVICAGIHFAATAPLKDKLTSNIPIMKTIAANLKKYCPRTIILMVTNPIDVLNYVMYLTGYFERNKLLGYNMNDSIRLRTATAKTLNLSPLRVDGIAAGYHPNPNVPLFSSIKVDGKPYLLDAEKQQQIREETKNYLKALDSFGANRTAGWTTAAGIAETVKAIRNDAKMVIPCSAVLEGEYGYKDISIGIPAIIGREGIQKILEWELPPEERRELDPIAGMLKADCALAKEMSGL